MILVYATGFLGEYYRRLFQNLRSFMVGNICLKRPWLKAITNPHTHTCSDLQLWTFYLQDSHSQPWTGFSVFTDDHGLCVYVCVCVCVCMCVCVCVRANVCVHVSNNYLTMDYRLPLRKSIVGTFFVRPCLCDSLPIEGSQFTVVCPRLNCHFSDVCP